MTATSTGMTRMESFPFDSKADGYDADGYPVYDRAVGASMLRSTFAKFFSNGVFPSPGDALQIGKGTSGLTVTIQPGIAIIDGAMGGVEGDDPITLTLDTAAPQGNVCYGIMLRYDNTDDARSLYFNVVRSDAAAEPSPPEPDTTTPEVYELRLGNIVVPSNATDLTDATVTNEKGLDVCPFAAPFEKIDMSGVTADAQASAQAALSALMQFIDTNKELVQSALDDTTAGQLQNQITALQEQIGNLDFSTMVDNVTIEYTQNLGDPSKLLRVKPGGIGPIQLSPESIVFADDPNSSANAEARTAATPECVDEKISMPFGFSAKGSFTTTDSVKTVDFTQGSVTGFTAETDGLIIPIPCIVIVKVKTGASNGEYQILLNGIAIAEYRNDVSSSTIVIAKQGDKLSITESPYGGVEIDYEIQGA